METASRVQYEAPAVTVLGTVHDITLGTYGAPGQDFFNYFTGGDHLFGS
jgi:hypothetical protein